MKRSLGIIAITAMLLGGVTPVPAQASAAVDAALGLGAFAVFSQILGWSLSRPYYAAPPVYYASTPVVYTAAPVYAPAPVAYAPAPPAVQREVVYPHGRYVLYGDGVTSAYQWVWVWNPPPVPAPPPAEAAPPPPPTGAPPPPPPGAR